MKVTYIHPAYPRILQSFLIGRGCMVIIERKNDEKGTPFFWMLKINGRDLVSSVTPFLVDGLDPFDLRPHVADGLAGYVRMEIVQEFINDLQDADYGVMYGTPLFIEAATEADWPRQNHQSAQAA